SEGFMSNALSRRTLLQFASTLLPARAMNSALESLGLVTPSSDDVPSTVRDVFPSQPPELVRETVVFAHFDLKRIKELVGPRPSLARATWDWGFGDWESALGAASHVGNRAIAEYLISQGARPSLFSAAMLGQLDVVKAFVAAQPQVERIR